MSLRVLDVSMRMAARGAFVVFEGVDRCGKTTQANMLVKSLQDAGKPAVFMRFPDRTTTIGQLINAYLTNAAELDDHAIHLLFSANRWEKVSAIQATLAAGTTIVCDRYAASGVAFSSAKPGMSMQWCKQSDAGLPAPDHVFFLDVPPEVAARRGGFGGERYEVAPFQLTVRENFSSLRDDTWEVVNADQAIDALQAELLAKTLAVVAASATAPLRKLWTTEIE